MTGKLKIHAFKLVAQEENQTNIEEIIEKIKDSKFNERIRKIGDSEVRVEHIEKLEDESIWLIDFVKFRNFNGPGKGSANSKVKPFEFGKNESFCEETGLLYDPNSGYCVVQYNHNGVRFGTIQQYLSMFLLDEVNIITLVPKYNEDAMRKFEKSKGMKKLTLKVDTRSLSNNDFQAGTSMTEALNIGNSSGAETIEITITAGRKKKHYLKSIAEKTTDIARQIAGNKPEAINKLEVSYVDKDSEKVQMLDLLGERLESTFTDIPLSEGLRWSLEDRKIALLRAYKSWKKQFND